jgi:hypothetical protein
VKKSNRVHIGDRAGSFNQYGYRIIRLDKTNIMESRLAYFYMNGVWPDYEIDHRNRDNGDNRWENLRAATKSQNAANRIRPNKRNLPRGVYYTPNRKKFSARSFVGSKTHYLGTFDNPEAASEAYINFVMNHFGEYSIESA